LIYISKRATVRLWRNGVLSGDLNGIKIENSLPSRGGNYPVCHVYLDYCLVDPLDKFQLQGYNARIEPHEETVLEHGVFIYVNTKSVAKQAWVAEEFHHLFKARRIDNNCVSLDQSSLHEARLIAVLVLL